MNKIHNRERKSMIEANKIQQLDLNLLKVFEAVYQERNMSTVAKTLFISPSAVSHAIKRLRTALDDELFVRQGSQLTPTALCDRMAPQLIDLLAQLRNVLQSCGEFDLKQSTRTFKVGLPDALEPILLPQLQRIMRAEAPNTKLQSVRIERNEITRQLTANHVDAVVDVVLPVKQPVEHLMLSSDEYCVVMDAQHPLRKKLTETSYLASEHIAVSTRAIGKVLEDYALLERGMNRQISVRCQNYYAAKQLIKGSELLLTAPKMIANQPQDTELAVVNLPFKIPRVTTHLYWHQNAQQDDAQVWFRSMLQKCFT